MKKDQKIGCAIAAIASAVLLVLGSVGFLWVGDEIAEVTYEPADEAPTERESEEADGREISGNWRGGFLLAGILIISTAFYFFPAFIALGRRHHNAIAILFLNLLLGWTVLGWIGAFIWSVTAIRD